MKNRPAQNESLRERTRRAVEKDISEAALRLFLERDFDSVTIEEIAAAVGISSRSFFRYFPTKEDVVLGFLVDMGKVARAALEARPRGEKPWVALRAALQVVIDRTDDDVDRGLRLQRMVSQTPSLHANHLEKRARWIELLVPDVAKRLGGKASELKARAIVASMLACFDAAADGWLALGGKEPLGQLLDQAIEAVRN